ncbi:MAG TPA: alpha/beta hydrolase [Ktedonobacterales bacterium]
MVSSPVSTPARESAPLPPGCEEGWVETNGARLHYVAADKGPLALLLHGFPEFWYSWRYQLPALAFGTHGGLHGSRRVVALDLRGYNLSEKPYTGYDMVTLTDDLRGAIAALTADVPEEQRVADVVGHDWGGILAWALALRAPDVVRRLAIVNAPHPATLRRELLHPRQWLRSSYIAFFQLRGIAERAIAREDFAMIRRTFRAADRERAWLSDDEINRFVAAIARAGAVSAALEYYRQLVRTGPDILGPMRVIPAPTLVLWGELDPYLGLNFLDGLDRWVGNLRIERFPTAGHWLNQQEPARVNTLLDAFLARS